MGPKLNTVFASRWKALMWAIGVLFSAWCIVPEAPEPDAAASDGTTSASSARQTGIEVPFFGRIGGEPEKPKSPWAPDAPAPASGQ